MLKFALRNLLSRPLRSTLAMLGLTVAIAGMVGLFSVARGLDNLVATTFGRIPGLIAMQPGAPIPIFSRIPADWQTDLAAVPGVRVVNCEVWQRANLIDGKTIITPPRFLFGTDIESRLRLESGVYRDNIVAGRFLERQDRGTNHTVVSRQIAEEFHKGVGDALQVNGYDLTIVGVYHCGSLLLDVAIILDIDRVRSMTRFDANSVSAFYIEPTAQTGTTELAERIRTAFRGRAIPPADGVSGLLSTFLSGAPNPAASRSGDDNSSQTEQADAAQTEPLEIRSAREWGERFEEFAADLDVFLVVITAIGVIVAVLSIVNTMLMSVTERIIEFGILKANGWSRTDVMKLITFESAGLGLGGGLLGSAFGWLGTQVVNWAWPDRIFLFAGPGLLAFGVGFSTVIGIFGGLYPAYRAMRMMPLEAIRRG